MTVYTADPRVEVAFGFGPYGPEPLTIDWEDVTSSVLEVAITRGRESEFDQFPASTATIVLKNDEREWDPLNAAGAHYGELLANVPIRIVADVGGTDHPVWRGYVDGWPAEYTEGGYRSEVTVTATDAFKLMAERPVPDTYLDFLNDLGFPDAWYPCDSRQLDQLRNRGTRGRAGTVLSALNAVEGIVAASTGALACPEQKPPLDNFYSAVDIPVPADTDNLIAGTQWSLSIVVQFAKFGFRSVFANVTNAGGTTFLLNVSGVDGHPIVVINAGLPNIAFEALGMNIADGRPHHLVVTRNGTSGWLYVDGALAATGTNGSATGAVDLSGGIHRIGRTSGGDGTTTYPEFMFDELMAWNGTVLTAGDVADLYAYLSVGFGEERTSGEAIEAILDLIGWPASLRSIDPGETVVQLPVNPGGTPALQLLQTVAATEGGRLFVDRTGKVTFHDRGRALREAVETAVQYTFSDQDRDLRPPPDVGLLDGTLRVVLDDQHLYEAAEISRVGGDTQSAGSATPSRTFTASDLLFAADAASLSLAEWIVFRYGTPQVRSDAWTIDPEIRPADWASILGLEVGHRVKLDLTPGGIGSSIDLEQHLELIEHEISPERWTIKLNGSPVDPASYFLWASSATADDDHGWADTDGTPPGGAWG